MWDYTEKVKDHYLNPRNVGEVEDADGIGEVGSLVCGDVLRISFKLDEDGRVADAKFQTFGCGSAIASASVLTEMMKGKTLEEMEAISNQDIVDYLGGLPDEKVHCSVMGREALEEAIANYRGVKPARAAGTVLCECFGVTDIEIEQAIRDNDLHTVEEVTNYTKAGGGCEKCHPKIQEILDRIQGVDQPAGPPARPMTNIQKIRLIEETLEREIQPSLRADGGDIELVDVEGNQVAVRLKGACLGCSAAHITLQDYVQVRLRELVSPDIEVMEVE